MKEMNSQLAVLIQKDADEMSHSEKLQRRLIVSWLRVIEELARQKHGATAS